MANWPALLPRPVMSGYKYRNEKNFLRTQMETGPARQRRRYTSVITEVDATFKFTHPQLALFESFFTNTLNDGVDWFQLAMVSGAGETVVDVRFKEPPEAAALANGNMWSLTAKVEIRNRPVSAQIASFNFTTVNNTPINQYVVSNEITISGLNGHMPIRVIDGHYQINDGAWKTNDGGVVNGDRVRVRHLSSDAYLTGTTTTLVIGTVSALFTSVTAAQGSEPEPQLTDGVGTSMSLLGTPGGLM